MRSGCGHTCGKKRISNIEQGMSNVEAIRQQGKDFIILNSMFDIRYYFRKQGKSIILELPTVEELAKHLLLFMGIAIRPL
jgi:hypothetical protein